MDNQKEIKKDFKPFEVGAVFNPLQKPLKTEAKHLYKEIIIDYPSRLEAMAIDPSKIAENNNLVYTPGQIDFTVKLFKRITVKVRDDNQVIISESSKRKPLIKHSAEIMRKALNTDIGLEIDVDDQINLRHCGLGSSSGLIAGVAAAINEVFGNPISAQTLVKYLAQNHGEEIDGDENLINPVQCIGGSAACGTHDGGIVILAGESLVVKTGDVDEEYEVVIGVPKDFKHPDSKYLMDKEIENLPKFMRCGRDYGQLIAYRLFHDCLPAMQEGNLEPLGDLIFDYRFKMGSIDNCSFVYPRMNEIAHNLEYLKKEKHCTILALSSVGPGFFAITQDLEVCKNAFEKEGMDTYVTKIHNAKYILVERKN